MSATPKDPRSKTMYAADFAPFIDSTNVRIYMDGQGGVYSMTIAPNTNDITATGVRR